MKILLHLLFAGGCLWPALADPDPVATAWPDPPPPHPRLYFADNALQRMARPADDPVTGPIVAQLQQHAKTLLAAPPVSRQLRGRRMLHQSRDALERLIHWGWAWRVGGEDVYLQRAIREMDAVSAFADWNPSHFLDVAEMTHALAIGYDTFYPALRPEQRSRYRDAIIRLGLEPGFADDHWWIDSDINWNQVCHGGLVAGALAVMEDAPELASRTVARAVKNVPLAMQSYGPDGAYPEGPGYWIYGSTYNVLLLDLLDQVLGTTFGLEDVPGFLESAEYFLHMTGPTGSWFQYPDCSPRGGPRALPFWFAGKCENPSLVWNELRWLEKTELRSGLAPLVLRWMPDIRKVPMPEALSWRGRGANPVAAHRTAWDDPQAGFLAIKGGSPGVSHGHMDLGAFVYQSQGVDWVVESGKEDYHSIESRGMSLWPRNNGAERWQIYRYHNRGHNTLVVNDAEQVAEAFAPLTEFSPWPNALTRFDLSAAYAPALQQAVRTATLQQEGAVIEDQLEVGDQPASIEWIFHTPAKVTVLKDGRLRLEKDGRSLWVQGPGGCQWNVRTLAVMPHEWDSPDPGLTRCAFVGKLPAGARVSWQIQFANAPRSR